MSIPLKCSSFVGGGSTRNPQILVVLVLPEDEATWIEHSVEALLIRRCAYWLRMDGQPKISAGFKTVHIPMANIFSPDGLMALMREADIQSTR